MKTIAMIMIGLLLSAAAMAQEDSTNKMKSKKPDPYIPEGRYCAVMEGGKLVVTLDGKPLKNDVQLKNGNRMTATGTVVRKDGTIQMLKPGTCVNTEGNEVEHASEK
jgi:hypothetical protein